MPSKANTNKSPFVSFAKLSEAIEVIKKWSELRLKQNNNNKIPLLEDPNEEMILLQINFKKIPFNRTTYIHTISLPNHWRHESEFETCLIVKDLNKKPLTDREADLDMTKSHYKELLENKESNELITEILPMRELRNEYKVYEAKQKLSNAFNMFLCDRKLMHNKFDYLPRLLGKTFWFDSKKVPIPIDLTDDNLKSQLELKLNQTYLYMSGKGTTSVINIGLLKQNTKKIAANLLAVNKKLFELFGENVRSLGLKTEKSMTITFFLDCGFVSDVELQKPFNDNKPIEDEFTHFTNANIQVFKNGNVKVVPKEDGSDDGMDQKEKDWLKINDKQNNRKRKRNNRKVITTGFRNVAKRPKLRKK